MSINRVNISHPQCVVDGVLFLVLGNHQGKGVCSCTGQLHLGQIVWTVDTDAIYERRGIRWGGREGIQSK